MASRVQLMFATDYDHPMKSVLQGHPEDRMPFCVASYRVLDDTGRVLASVTGNYQTRATLVLPQPVKTSALRIELERPAPNIPAAFFEVRCYEEG